MLATFCDVLMSTACAYLGQDRTPVLPTVSLSIDYLQPTPADAWVEIRTDLLRRGRTLAFAQALLTADGQPCVRANGVFSVPPPKPDAPDLMRALKALLTGA